VTTAAASSPDTSLAGAHKTAAGNRENASSRANHHRIRRQIQAPPLGSLESFFENDRFGRFRSKILIIFIEFVVTIIVVGVSGVAVVAVVAVGTLAVSATMLIAAPGSLAPCMTTTAAAIATASAGTPGTSRGRVVIDHAAWWFLLLNDRA